MFTCLTLPDQLCIVIFGKIHGTAALGSVPFVSPVLRIHLY